MKGKLNRFCPFAVSAVSAVSVHTHCHLEPQARELIKAVPLRGKILRAKALRMTKIEYRVPFCSVTGRTDGKPSKFCGFSHYSTLLSSFSTEMWVKYRLKRGLVLFSPIMRRTTLLLDDKRMCQGCGTPGLQDDKRMCLGSRMPGLQDDKRMCLCSRTSVL